MKKIYTSITVAVISTIITIVVLILLNEKQNENDYLMMEKLGYESLYDYKESKEMKMSDSSKYYDQKAISEGYKNASEKQLAISLGLSSKYSLDQYFIKIEKEKEEAEAKKLNENQEGKIAGLMNCATLHLFMAGASQEGRNKEDHKEKLSMLQDALRRYAKIENVDIDKIDKKVMEDTMILFTKARQTDDNGKSLIMEKSNACVSFVSKQDDLVLFKN